jgi:trimeric autotransporter adhesin
MVPPSCDTTRLGRGVHLCGAALLACALLVSTRASAGPAQNHPWQALGGGVDGLVTAIAVHGNDVYVGGMFTTAGGVTVNNIAKWDGQQWSALGTGVDGRVSGIAVHGTDVFIGGGFTKAGGVNMPGGTHLGNVAQWDGSAWVIPGTGLNGTIDGMAVVGDDVYAFGEFATCGGFAKFDGSDWVTIGGGTSNNVRAIAVQGPDFYIAGDFTHVGPYPDGFDVNHVARWDGSGWSALGDGLTTANNALAAIAVYKNKIGRAHV